MPRISKLVIYVFLALVVLAAGLFLFTKKLSQFNVPGIVAQTSSIVSPEIRIPPPSRLANPPHPIKGIYISAWAAGSSKRLAELVNLIETTELNGLVVDVKDASGSLTYRADVPLAEAIGANDDIKIGDIDDFIEDLHDRNIYVIGRVQVFQDQVFAKARPDIAVKNSKDSQLWRDRKGLAWLDPSSRLVWQYAVNLAKDMAKHGFDEVNFDYVRFPADGVIENLDFPFWDGTRPKYELVGNFFAYLSQNLKGANIAVSVDVFGLTAWRSHDFGFDLNIGQRLIDALAYFDYVSPMVYPSHYPTGFAGTKNPESQPYEIVYGSLHSAQDLVATTSYKAVLRPWLQDFSLSVPYDKQKVRAQIKAVYDAGIQTWLLWNASSRYTKEALLPREANLAP